MIAPDFSPFAPIAAASVVVFELGNSYGLGFVAADGRIVTSLHLMVGERVVQAHLGDGRTRLLHTLTAIDSRRDLAIAEIEGLGVPPATHAPPRLAEEGSPVFVFGMASEGSRLKWSQASISSIQVLGGTLTVYRIEGEVPPDASGGPLFNERGEVLGVVTVGETEAGAAVLGIPWKYVAPLLQANDRRSLASLITPKKQVRREVPEHPMSLLEGSTSQGLHSVLTEIAGAIQLGAPAYNQGNVEGCYRVYADAAKRLVSARSDCPGPRRALQQGLARAQSMHDVDSQAWAMRDAFDGLLAVIEKFFRAQTPSLSKGPRKPPGLPN